MIRVYRRPASPNARGQSQLTGLRMSSIPQLSRTRYIVQCLGKPWPDVHLLCPSRDPLITTRRLLVDIRRQKQNGWVVATCKAYCSSWAVKINYCSLAKFSKNHYTFEWFTWTSPLFDHPFSASVQVSLCSTSWDGDRGAILRRFLSLPMSNRWNGLVGSLLLLL